MPLTLELSPDLELALEEAAQVEGHNPADYAAHILHMHLSPVMALMQRAGRLNRATGDATAIAAPIGEGKTSAAQHAAIAHKLALLDEWESEVAARPDYRAQAGLGPLPNDAVEDVYRAREDVQL